MRARTINETFKRGLDPKKAMNIGIHPRHKTKSWKILEFIDSFGKEGVRYTDIQKYIYFELNKAPFGPDYFSMEEPKKWHSKDYPRQRAGRGYWATNLYGTYAKRGLLRNYCVKNDKGKWVLDHYPSRERKNLY